MNTAIDEVGRQMTEGSPAGSADFRRRVLARVEAGDAPRATWRAAWLLSPLAVAAAIVTAIFVARSRPGPLGPGVTSSEMHTAAGQNPTPQQETVSPDQITVRLKPPLDAARGGPEPVEVPDATGRAVTNRAAADPKGPALQIDALAAPSLDIAPLTVDALTPDRIQIERLDALTPLRVAPLDITDVQRRYE